MTLPKISDLRRKIEQDRVAARVVRWGLLIIAFLLGVMITIAEPDLSVLAEKVQELYANRQTYIDAMSQSKQRDSG